MSVVRLYPMAEGSSQSMMSGHLFVTIELTDVLDGYLVTDNREPDTAFG